MYGLRNSDLSTCLFQFSHKTRQTMLLYAYFTPKVDFKRKFNHQQSFLYDDDWQRGRFENFESDHQYESNLESDVRFEIESNHEASQHILPVLRHIKSMTLNLALRSSEVVDFASIESAYMAFYWNSIVTLVFPHFRVNRAFLRRKPLFRHPSSIPVKISAYSLGAA